MKLNGKDIKFARFGGLSPVKQKGYSKEMESFHSPPCKKGIYAFIHPYYEPFLLGGLEYSGFGTKHSKFERIKDESGNPIQTNESYIEGYNGTNNWMKFWGIHYNDEGGPYDLLKPKKVKIFEHKGELWHHLGQHLKPSEILRIKGSWYLTDFKSFGKALIKESNKTKSFLKKWEIESNNPFGYSSLDHLEVFIEKMK